MKKYTVCICDAEQPARNILKKYILQYSERLRNVGNTAVIILIPALKSMSLEGYRAEPFRNLHQNHQ